MWTTLDLILKLCKTQIMFYTHTKKTLNYCYIWKIVIQLTYQSCLPTHNLFTYDEMKSPTKKWNRTISKVKSQLLWEYFVLDRTILKKMHINWLYRFMQLFHKPCLSALLNFARCHYKTCLQCDFWCYYI